MKPSKKLEEQIDSEKDMEIGAGIWPPKCSISLNDLAHEIWATAQLLPGEGIEDGVNRLESLLQDSIIGRKALCLDKLVKAAKTIRDYPKYLEVGSPGYISFVEATEILDEAIKDYEEMKS
jgi:hypothetical protein